MISLLGAIFFLLAGLPHSFSAHNDYVHNIQGQITVLLSIDTDAEKVQMNAGSDYVSAAKAITWDLQGLIGIDVQISGEKPPKKLGTFHRLFWASLRQQMVALGYLENGYQNESVGMIKYGLKVYGDAVKLLQKAETVLQFEDTVG